MDPGEPHEDFPAPNKEEHPRILQNQTPNFLVNGVHQGILFVQQYGWFLLIGIVVLLYAKSKLQPYIDEQRRKRELDAEYRNYDEDAARSRHEAMEAARRRLQEKHDAQAAEFAEKQRQKEEERRKAKIEDWERHKQGLGYRSKIHKEEEQQPSGSSGFKSKKDKKPLRDPDYNPLMGGGGGGACFRPARRGGAGGG